MQYLISRLKLVVNVSIEGKGNFHLGHAIFKNPVLQHTEGLVMFVLISSVGVWAAKLLNCLLAQHLAIFG